MGLEMGQVCRIAERNVSSRPRRTQVILWPEMLWRIKHWTPPENEDDDGGSDAT